MVASGVCTAESTDEFYSFRAEGRTGRHGALAVILGPDR
jgi:copper oxidase (laccase) domain-containing protein